jgi:hypothetical protein
MAPVIVSILPRALRQYLHPDLFIGRLPNIPAYTLVFSLVLGALTHIGWDFFTHQRGIPQYFEWMDTPFARIDGYDIMPYRILQHFSTLFGMILLSFWVWVWYSKKKISNHTETVTKKWIAPSSLKKISFIILLFVPVAVGILNGINNLPETDVLNGMYSKQMFVRHLILAWAAVFIISTTLLGVVYQYLIYKRR